MSLKSLTFEEFVIKSNLVHPVGMYTYPIQMFKNTKTKVRIFCTEGNHEFEQMPSVHLLGKGCRVCTRLKHRKTFKQFMSESINKFGDKFEFPDKIYINSFTKIKVICKVCLNSFKQTPVTHLNSVTGCSFCGLKQAKINITKSYESFLEKVLIIHGDKYTFTKEGFKGRKDKIKIYCNTCQTHFESMPNSILNGMGCSSCSTHAVSPDKEGLVYKITCKATGMIYVGITTVGIKSRFTRHLDYAKRKKIKNIFAQDLVKYGRDGFIIEEIQSEKASNLPACEINWIKQLNCLTPYGYNISIGGGGLQFKK